MTADVRAPLIALRDVGVGFPIRRGRLRRADVFWALRNVTCELRRGESLAVVGRNGAGKSTLLRLLAGIIRPDAGELDQQGASASLLSIGVGFVPYLSGRENIVLSGMLLGLTREAVEGCMNEIIEFAELGEFIDAPIQTYSSGMRARLGFSIAFQAEPDILLVDEVLGVGDAGFVQKSSALLRERIRSERTVVLASHDLGAVRALCDRAIWLERGIPRAQGETGVVVDRYQDFVVSQRPAPLEPPVDADRGVADTAERPPGMRA